MHNNFNNILKMSTPPYLQKGDKVAILCPAGFISEDLEPAYQILKNWGLHPIVYPSVNAQDNYFAGNDDLRKNDLQYALDNPEIKCIIAARGGYGCVRIIDKLNFEKFIKNPKWLVGFSDLTVILSHIQHNFQIPTIHGQMVKAFLKATPSSLISLYNVLFGISKDLCYTSNNKLNRPGKAKGTLIGGNLAILHSILASNSDPNYDGKILFIEDVGESYYNIDRMLWTLKRANKLNNLKGLIVGGFTELKDSNPSFGYTFEEIIFEIVKEFNFPIAFDCPAGHIENNHALIIGQEIELNIHKDKVKITYTDSN